MVENITITIDPDALADCASRLERIALDLGADGARIESARIPGSALGLMNAWLVPPVEELAATAAELVSAGGAVAAAIGAATTATAADFDATEQQAVAELRALDAELG